MTSGVYVYLLRVFVEPRYTNVLERRAPSLLVYIWFIQDQRILLAPHVNRKFERYLSLLRRPEEIT